MVESTRQLSFQDIKKLPKKKRPFDEMSHPATISAVIRTKCVIGSNIRYWMHKR